MKFIILFLSLLVYTSVLSKTIHKRDVVIKSSKYGNISVSEACRNELYDKNNPINKCIADKSIIVNDKGACPDINSSECQKVYNDRMSALPSCKEYPKIAQIFSQTFMQTSLATQKLYCQLDEYGSPCPYPDILTSYTATYEELIPTCKSKVCTDQLVSIIEILSTNTKTNKNNKTKMLNILKSGECTSLATGNNNIDSTTNNAVNDSVTNNTLGNNTDGTTNNTIGNNVNNNNTNNNTNTMNSNNMDDKSDAKTLKVGINFILSISLLLLSIY
ncbi:hypothetical protein BCR32DRAFT_328578 [Anaeromyces robustus]|jgi:hypothetical protein|uniref:Uncharacterized protein n=1 Tax=Anaeromyces robustus TaxID=1754192 RepID=A0A1Y1WZ37_9FUNG|nr:hypothetical protein BCR32DRAFT_328578 [Anaeromyces robustus]|eukprot:ORX78354.1 hypothetical protein BCR32DRAFT_328578 [Anaeromyces robustus]